MWMYEHTQCNQRSMRTNLHALGHIGRRVRPSRPFCVCVIWVKFLGFVLRMACEVPLWVAQVFPSYFNNGRLLKKRKKNTRHFSDAGVETEIGMPQNIPHDTDLHNNQIVFAIMIGLGKHVCYSGRVWGERQPNVVTTLKIWFLAICVALDTSFMSSVLKTKT